MMKWNFIQANVLQDETKLQYLKGISAMGLGKHDEAENFFNKQKITYRAQ